MAFDPLRGSCSCGRNEYQINIPDDVTDHAEVYFDSSRDNRGQIQTKLVDLPANIEF